MAHIIGVTSLKGGCGKTSTTKILSELYGKMGKRVLAVDFDSQASLTISVEVKVDRFEANIAECLFSVEDSSPVILETENYVDLLPADDRLALFEMQETAEKDRLKKVLDKVADSYDIIIIDSPPGTGWLMQNMIYASDSLLIVGIADKFCFERVDLITDFARSVKEDIDILGIVINMYSTRTIIAGQMLNAIDESARAFGYRVLFPCVRSAVAVSEASALGVPLVDYAKKSKPLEDYKEIASQILDKIVR